MVDRHGNHVDYAYGCNTRATECTIANISYVNQGAASALSQITFTAETRPDVISYASGKDIRGITQRITSIKIDNGIGSRAASTLLRGYNLIYQASPTTSFSRLIQVQEFGRDAAFAGSVFSGGTSMPPFVMSYSDVTGGATGPGFTSKQLTVSPASAAGDFNGDGSIDLASVKTTYTQTCSQGSSCSTSLTAYGPINVYSYLGQNLTKFAAIGYTTGSQDPIVPQPFGEAVDVNGDGTAELPISSPSLQQQCNQTTGQGSSCSNVLTSLALR